jgi:hypothetical protein
VTQTARERIDPEQALRQAIATGALVDLRTGQHEADDPARGATWEEPRTVHAELLAELLTQPVEGERRPRALRLAGARITGALDLEGAELVCSLLLHGCWFEEPVILAEAQAVAVRLPGCQVPALQAAQLVTRGNLELGEGFTAHPEVRLLGAHIGGHLNLSGATLANPDGPALTGDQLTVEQGMFCREGFTTQGEVRLLGAHIGGSLDFSQAALANPDGPALNADGLAVDRAML